MTTMLGETDLTELTAAKIVDARGAACPGPLLEAKKAMGSVAVGDVLELWSSDSQTKNDVAAWSGKVGHEFLGVVATRRLRARLHPPDEVTETLVSRAGARAGNRSAGARLLDEHDLRPGDRPGGQLAHALLAERRRDQPALHERDPAGLDPARAPAGLRRRLRRLRRRRVRVPARLQRAVLADRRRGAGAARERTGSTAAA